MLTDGRADMTKQIVFFLNFVKAPKKHMSILLPPTTMFRHSAE